MKLHQPLHVLAYILGVLPKTVRSTVDPHRQRFRIHGPGLAIKAINTLLYWLVSTLVSIVTIRNLQHYQTLTKKILTTRVLDIEELYVYMMFVGIVATTVCQAHLLCPHVTRAMDQCFFDLCQLNDIAGAWQFFSAFGIVLFIVYEFAMYYVLITYK